MAVRMVPHGRRGWMKFGAKHYAILNAQVSQPRNLIVPPVLSRDYEFAVAEGVRTAQITMQVPMFTPTPNNADFGSALEDDFIGFLFKREDDLTNFAVSDTVPANIEIYDGVNLLQYQGVRVNRVSLSVQKGQVLLWNLEMMCLQISQGASGAPAWFKKWASFPTPRTFRDVQFVFRSSNTWGIFKTPVYNADFTVMHNLTLNMPITDDTGVNIPGAARLDAGPPNAMVNATFQAYRLDKSSAANILGSLAADLQDLAALLNDNAGFGVRINRGAQPGPTTNGSFNQYVDIRFPRVIAENRDDTTAQFGQQFRTLRFRCLGDPRGTDGNDEYTERYPFVYTIVD